MDVLIGNPAAGRGKGAALLARAEETARRTGRSLRVCVSERPGHAVALAAEAGEAGATLILAAGGDGTVRDIAEGLARLPEDRRPPLALVPLGTGNDLSRTLGIPREVEPALEIAFNGKDRWIDHWSWNDTPFLNVAGVGLDAAVAGEVNRRFRHLSGPLPYVAGLLSVLPRFRPVEMCLTWPGGEWEGRAWLTAFGSGKFYGGGMMIAPNSVPDDGALSVVVVEDVPKLELLRQFPGIFRGTHIRHPRVRSFSAAEVEVRAVEQDVTLDGELIGRTPARVRALGKLRVRVPHD
jgi:diacylglycerol kinase (ATP)